MKERREKEERKRGKRKKTNVLFVVMEVLIASMMYSR